MRIVFCFLTLILINSQLSAGTSQKNYPQKDEKPFIIGDLLGQMGNNLFQVAVASSLAWDHGAEAYFPQLPIVPTLYNHIFSRCKITQPTEAIEFNWIEPDFSYHEIPYHPNMQLKGYFQSEKYFKHNRAKILELFAPITNDLKYIKKKYSSILNHPKTVGVQIRYYFEDQNGDYFIQYGKDYLDKSMALFPEDSLFVVSSNNLDFAKQNIPSWVKNVFYLENEKFYIEFYLLSFCKHNIISNSSFGWWSAWLNQNPDKIVIRPSVWINGLPYQDVCPKEWIALESKKGCVKDPTSY